MRYKVYPDRLKLYSSAVVPKSRYETELQRIRNLHPSMPLWMNRSTRSIKLEWATHTMLYNLGLWIDKTADVDLEYEPRWYKKLAYWAVGAIALSVIK